MSYIENSLSEGEVVEARFTLHWMNWIGVWMATLTVILIPVAAWMAIQIKTREFGVTNRRIIFKKGWIARTSEEMKITSVETVTIDQSLWGRLLGFGTVRVTGRGTSDVVFESIDDPMDVKRSIETIVAREEARGLRDDDDT